MMREFVSIAVPVALEFIALTTVFAVCLLLYVVTP